MHLVEGKRSAINVLLRTFDPANQPAQPPRVGIQPEAVVCSLKRANEIEWRAKSLTPANWQDTGHGVYVLTLEANDFDATGPLVVLLEGAAELKPAIAPVLETYEVVPPLPRGLGAVMQTTLVGQIATLDLKGKQRAQVLVRIAAMPLVIGGVALTNEVLTVESDEDGCFKFDAITGATINVQIPFANYQRQFVVPPPPAPGLPVRLFAL